MQNEEGQVTELYIPRKCSATNRMITSKDHASVQLNIGHLDADGIYTGQFTTLALCGFVRAQVCHRLIFRFWNLCVINLSIVVGFFCCLLNGLVA
ncbi:hypothetical protein YC2023_086045 [Brassica napus]